jgi:hypothetical protein
MVGRIAPRRRLIDYAVVEIDQGAAEGLRFLMLATTAAVEYWLKESSRGGTVESIVRPSSRFPRRAEPGDGPRPEDGVRGPRRQRAVVPIVVPI